MEKFDQGAFLASGSDRCIAEGTALLESPERVPELEPPVTVTCERDALELLAAF